MKSKEEIIAQGYIDLRARVAGIIQSHRFIVQKEKTGFGEILILVTKGNVTVGELARLSEEIQLPLRSPFGTAFPRGKGPKDFINI